MRTLRSPFSAFRHKKGSYCSIDDYSSILQQPHSIIKPLEAIILHEQPNSGKKIIEKIEANSDVQYAVVYISMDDAGAWKTELAREMKSIGLEVDMNKL